MSLRIYKKKLNYSYTMGIFPTIELLQTHSDKVTTVLISPEYADSEGVMTIKKLCKQHDINVDVSPRAINKLSAKENTAAIGVFKKYEHPLAQDKNHLALVNPSDMGNVGTIARTMLGYKFSDLALIRPAVDVYHPRLVRSSMGAVFKVNFQYFSSFDEYSSRFPNHIPYTFVLNGTTNLADLKPQVPFSLVFGNEGAGLDDYFAKLENAVRIDHSNDIDSLNLSVAVGIALYEVSKA